MIDSPNNLQDAGPGAEAQSEIGIRQPNGKYNSVYLKRSRKHVRHFEWLPPNIISIFKLSYKIK